MPFMDNKVINDFTYYVYLKIFCKLAAGKTFIHKFS